MDAGQIQERTRDESMGMPSREKSWNELDVDQKLERMRQIVKQLTQHFGMVQEVVSSLRHAVQVHEHLNGKIVTPLPHPGEYETPELGRREVSDKDIYF